jgi:[ribosomal protein S5]-alanine N-acetyltransferase
MCQTASYAEPMPKDDVSEEMIATSRLELHHICVDDLVSLFESPEDVSVYEGQPYSNPHRVLMDQSGPLRWRVPQVKSNSSVNKWFVRWMVEKETREIVGSTSFHGPPDEQGMMEIGLGVHEHFQRRGYATEALTGMWSWVINQPNVEVLRYTVAPDNLASIAVVEKFGFACVGQQIDPEDGLEDIYEMPAEEFRIRFSQRPGGL